MLHITNVEILMEFLKKQLQFPMDALLMQIVVNIYKIKQYIYLYRCHDYLIFVCEIKFSSFHTKPELKQLTSAILLIYESIN